MGRTNSGCFKLTALVLTQVASWLIKRGTKKGRQMRKVKWENKNLTKLRFDLYSLTLCKLLFTT
jgi:hypothetical protein